MFVQVEEMPHEAFAFMIIGDFLFSRTSDEFSKFLNQEPRLQLLLSEPLSFWIEMVTRYFVNAPHISVSYALYSLPFFVLIFIISNM